MVAAGPNRFGVFTLLLRQYSVQQESGHADHPVHRRPDFVTHAGKKQRLGLGCGLRFSQRPVQLMVDLLQLLSIVFQRLLRFLPSGDIPNERAEKSGPLNGQRRHGDFHGEFSTVSPKPGHLHQPLGSRHIPRLEKAPHILPIARTMGRRADRVGRIPPDGLKPGPSEDLFRLGVPLRDTAVVIHGHDRIKSRVDDQAGAGLVLMQRRFHFSPLDEETDLASGRAQCP